MTHTIGAYVYNKMFDIVRPAFDLIASSAPDAKYGPRDLCYVGAAQCTHNKTAAPMIPRMRRRGMMVVRSQRFLQLLGAIPYDEMLDSCLDMMKRSAQEAIQVGRLSGKVTMATNEHLKPRYDKLGKGHPDVKSGQKRRAPTSLKGI